MAGFKVGTAYIELKVDQNGIQAGLRQLPGNQGGAANQAGQGLGGKIAEGMRLSIIRNSPLIAAAVGGGLAAGAPVAIAGATALFAGIGAVAAAQTDEVKAAWIGLGHQIKQSAIADAAVVVPTYVGMAGQIGSAFQRLRPQLREAFEAANPQVTTFTEGIIGLARNAMPGLLSAVREGDPVMRGLAGLLESTGTAVSGFFEGIAEHGPAAGRVFTTLGDTLEGLLPALGDVLGSGTEIAAAVLPGIASALTGLAGAAQSVGPLLSSVVTALIGFKLAGAAAGLLGGLSTQLTRLSQSLALASYGSGAFAGTAGKMSTAMAGLARGVQAAGVGLPILGGMFAMIAADMSEATSQEEKWAQALLAGGEAADEATAAADRQAQALLNGLDEWSGLSASMDDAKARAAELYAQMTPLERKQTDLTRATNEARQAAEEYGLGSPQHVAALGEQERATAEVEAEQARLAGTLNAVTQAMLDQANQALASIDSSFNYRMQVDTLEDSQAAYNQAIRDNGPASEEAARAQLDLEQQTFRTAQAFAQEQADLSGLQRGTAEYDRYVQEQTLVGLKELQKQAGPEMAAAIQQQIGRLEASGITLSSTATAAANTAGKMQDLGLSVTQIPGAKDVFINAPTEDQRRRIEELGYRIITLPDGSVMVTADTWSAERAINNAARNRTSTITVQTRIAGGATVNSLGLGRAAGGPVPRGYAGGGEIVGPGGPTDDLVPAVGPGGRPIRLSDEEWIIRAAAARRYGDRAMAAVNEGRAVIAFTDGGRVGGGQGGAGGRAGGGVVIQNLTIPVQGVWDFASPTARLQLGENLRQLIREVERSHS